VLPCKTRPSVGSTTIWRIKTVSERHGPAVRIRRNFASSDLELFSPEGGTVHELIYSEIGNEVLLIKYVDSVPVINTA
jgi:hypothetical protein